MKSVMPSVLLIAFVVLFARHCPAQAVAEGTWTEKKITILGEETVTKRNVRVCFGKDMLKIEDSLLAETTIIRLDKKLLWLVDTKAKTSVEITFEQIAQARQRTIDDIKTARGHVAGSSEETKLTAVLEALSEYESGEPAVSAAQPGESREIAGRKAERAIVKLADNVVADIWSSGETSVSTPFLNFFTALQGRATKLADEFAKMDKLPLAGVFRIDCLIEMCEITFEFASAKTAELTEADFTLPEGLRKIDSPVFSPPAKPAEKPATPEEKK
jgi:hypothetical protein